MSHEKEIVNIFKAGQTNKDIPNCQINIDSEIPPTKSLSDGLFQIFKKDAEALADVLWASLPGGTIDCLTVEMLKRNQRYLSVPYEKST